MKRDLLLSILAAAAAIVTLSLTASCAKTNPEPDPEAPENGEENSYLFRYTAPEETVPDDWAGFRHDFDAVTGEGWIELPDDVTEIPGDAFFETGLTSIEIPASVMNIGAYAFGECNNLGCVTFADGSQLSTIGEDAFWGTGLTSIEIPASVMNIGEYAFWKCNNLGCVTFADGSQLSTIGKKAFCETGLTSIEIPASVTEIKEDAFASCDNLKCVTFAEGSQLKTIGERAFKYCNHLTRIEIPASVTEIKESACESCGNLRSVTFAVGSQLKTIRDAAFEYSGLTTIKIPESVRYIGEEAFYYSRYLGTVIFLSSVPPFHGEDVFGGCVSLEAAYVPDGSMDAYRALWPGYAYIFYEERLRQKEINMTVSEVTDNTAVVNCFFTPAKSSTYQVRIGGTVSEEFSESVRLRISNLASGENHRITATVFDTNHNQVCTEDLDFMTTGIPTGATQEDAVIERIDDPLLVTLTVSSDSTGRVWIGDDESVTSGQFQFGQQVEIHAAPNDGFIFLKWNDDNLEQSRTVTVGPADTEYSATFISSDIKSFTVNSQGKKVVFSKGNLWADSSNELHFENNQWEFSDRYDREHVSYFTWSSTISDATGMYCTGGNLFCDEDHKQSVDGSEAIYYALSIEEWQYLFDTHDCRWVNVNGVRGYLIAPDGVTLSANKARYTYDDLVVDKLVFLPAMGLRAEFSTFNGGIVGLYWSSTEVEDYPGGASYNMRFDYPDEAFTEYSLNEWEWGGSIRLVSDCQ